MSVSFKSHIPLYVLDPNMKRTIFLSFYHEKKCKCHHIWINPMRQKQSVYNTDRNHMKPQIDKVNETTALKRPNLMNNEVR